MIDYFIPIFIQPDWLTYWYVKIFLFKSMDMISIQIEIYTFASPAIFWEYQTLIDAREIQYVQTSPSRAVNKCGDVSDDVHLCGGWAVLKNKYVSPG
jgi:hypothetical protein